MAKTKTETVAETDSPDITVPEHSAVTVITNTPESFRAHYPEMVAKIESDAAEKAKPEWQKQERERLSALNAAFADDPKFANESFIAGLNVDQAKANRHDALVAKLKAAEAKIEQVRSEVPHVASDSETPTAPVETGDPVSRIEAEAKVKWAKDPNIEAEFGDFKTYLAYQKASAKGSFRLLTRQEVVK